MTTALLRQVGGAPLPSQVADQETTPVSGDRPATVVDQVAAFRRATEENAPGAQPKQARPGVVVRQAAAVSGPEGQLRHPGVEVAGVDTTELARGSQVTAKALRDVLTTGKGAGALKGFLQARGHEEEVGMIESEDGSLSATL